MMETAAATFGVMLLVCTAAITVILVALTFAVIRDVFFG